MKDYLPEKDSLLEKFEPANGDRLEKSWIDD